MLRFPALPPGALALMSDQTQFPRCQQGTVLLKHLLLDRGACILRDRSARSDRLEMGNRLRRTNQLRSVYGRDADPDEPRTNNYASRTASWSWLPSCPEVWFWSFARHGPLRTAGARTVDPHLAVAQMPLRLGHWDSFERHIRWRRLPSVKAQAAAAQPQEIPAFAPHRSAPRGNPHSPRSGLLDRRPAP